MSEDEAGLREVWRHAEGAFASWFDQAGVGIAQLDTRTGKFVRVNARYCDIVGYSRDELEATDFQTLTLPEDRNEDLQQMRRLVAGELRGFTLEKRYRHKQGHAVWVSLTVTPLWQPGEAPAFHLAIVQDITAKRHAVEARALIFERISDAFVALDRDWHYTYVNTKAGELFGRDPAQLVGKHIWTEFPEGVGQPFHRAYEQAMADQQPATIEAFYPPYEKWFENRIYPGPNGLSIYFHDITERKQAVTKQSELERQLAQSQKMESLGKLAGGIAHDMNNVLASILSLASMHQELHRGDAALSEAFDIITTAATRGAATVRQLLSFARQRPASFDVLDLNALVLSQTQLLQSTTLARASVEFDLAKDLSPVRGDASALANVLMNLCVNSLDAMSLGGTLTLRTRNEGSEVVVEVEDNGEGMSPEVQERAFDPFFTTKAAGEGTGLGLSVAFRTVQAHGGQLTLRSVVGEGTRAQMRLPQGAATAPTPAPGAQTTPERRPLRAAVLLVDDDTLVQRSLLRLLTALGCTVTVADRGERALELVADGLRPDVCMLDVHMPGLDGMQTLPRLRALLPTLPVILSSGKSDQSVLDFVATWDRVSLLTKPFGAAELRGALEAALAPTTG